MQHFNEVTWMVSVDTFFLHLLQTTWFDWLLEVWSCDESIDNMRSSALSSAPTLAPLSCEHWVKLVHLFILLVVGAGSEFFRLFSVMLNDLPSGCSQPWIYIPPNVSNKSTISQKISTELVNLNAASRCNKLLRIERYEINNILADKNI